MGKTILIADDDPVVRLILSAILEAQGHTVETVDSGAACLAYISQRASAGSLPELIFLDHLLQDMSGIEVLAQIRSLTTKPLPVVMLSANSKEEILNLAPQATPDYFLEKPFTSEAVARALSEVEAAATQSS